MPYRSRLPKIAAEIAPALDVIARAGAELVEAHAEERVPVETGRLRDAIHVEQERPGAYFVVAGDNEAFYGHIVEHGGVNTPPHPFLIPAGQQARKEIRAAARAEIKRKLA